MYFYQSVLMPMSRSARSCSIKVLEQPSFHGFPYGIIFIGYIGTGRDKQGEEVKDKSFQGLDCLVMPAACQPMQKLKKQAEDAVVGLDSPALKEQARVLPALLDEAPWSAWVVRIHCRFRVYHYSGN